MKMPRVEIGAVQSLGRHDTAAVAATGRQAAATGQQQQKMLSLMADVAGDYIQRQQNVEYDNAVAQSQIQLNDFQRSHGAKQFYRASDIPSNIPAEMIPRTDATFVNGERVETERESIPAYEVYPHLLKQQLEGMTEVNAEKISNPVLRKEYLRTAQVMNSELMMSAGLRAEEQQQQFVFTDGVQKAESAFKNGDWVAGSFYVENLVADDNVKAAMMKKGENLVELYEVGQASRSTNPEHIAMVRSRYNDANYEGSLSEGQRRNGVADMNAQLVALGAERVGELTRQEEISNVEFVEQIKTGDAGEKEIQAKFDLYKESPNAEGAIDSVLYGKMMSMSRAYDQSVEVENRRLEREAKAEAKAEEVVQTKAYNEANSNFYAKIHAQVDRNEINLTGVEELHEDYLDSKGENGTPNPLTINGPQLTALRHHIQERNARKAKSADLVAVYNGIMDGTIRGDADYKLHEDAIDQMVIDKGLTPENAVELGIIAKRAGIVPQMLETKMNGYLLEGTPEEAALSLTMHMNLTKDAPHLAMQFAPEARKVFRLAEQWALASVPMDQAINKAREYAIEITPLKEKEYLAEYREKDVDELDALQDLMDNDDRYDYGAFNLSDTTASSDQLFDFSELTKLYIPIHKGNVVTAQAAAYSDLRGKYSKTGVGIGINGTEGIRDAAYTPEQLLDLPTATVQAGLDIYAKSFDLKSEGLMLRPTTSTLKDHTWDVLSVNAETGEFTRHPPFKGSEWVVKAYEDSTEARKAAARAKQANENRTNPRMK